MTDWGVPDWRDADQYPSERTALQWWWEFTRRNPDYRDLWTIWSEYHLRLAKRGMVAKNESQIVVGTNEAANELRYRFKIGSLLNPAIVPDDHYLRHIHFTSGPYGIIGMGSSINDDADQESWFTINLNLDRSIDEQLPALRHLFKREQEKRQGKITIKRPRKSNWPLFLRALDARDAGATFAEIADAFWPDFKPDNKPPQKARDIYVAACALRDKPPPV